MYVCAWEQIWYFWYYTRPRHQDVALITYIQSEQYKICQFNPPQRLHKCMFEAIEKTYYVLH